MIKTLLSKLNLKRPKIVEQIIVVLLFAVLIPFVTVGIIIANVSQHSVRRELAYSAKMLAQNTGELILVYKKTQGNADKEYIYELLNDRFKKEKREIYVLDKNKKLIATNSKNPDDFEDIVSDLPLIMLKNTPDIFGKIKNQPMAYYKIGDLDYIIVVNTTSGIMENTINVARFKIILALSLAACFIFLIVGIYTFYLYLNMRQLLKGVSALSKGNYERKIRLIKNIFSPYEMYYLTKQFNYMARKINASYKELSKKNIELEKLNEFRSNLVSATSHEFRTPLTSIIGYSSRLMRQDIVLDETMKMKSLKIIKEQAQMLSRMVEDLLVIPEIESFSLKFLKSEVNIADCLEKTTIYCNPKGRKINLNVDDRLPKIISDEDRVMQILLNLVDNAIKYSEPEDEVDVDAQFDGRKIKVEIKNNYEKIDDETLSKLCDKFIRMDSDLTRTTRGTGLGLYIVKGLSGALNIDFSVKSEDGKFIATLIFEDLIKWNLWI